MVLSIRCVDEVFIAKKMKSQDELSNKLYVFAWRTKISIGERCSREALHKSFALDEMISQECPELNGSESEVARCCETAQVMAKSAWTQSVRR